MTTRRDGRLAILAGGISSRMKLPAQHSESINANLLQQADERPKGMIRLSEKQRPFLDYLLYDAWQAGIGDVVVVIGERDDLIRSYYEGDQSWFGSRGGRISFAIQRIPPHRQKPWGTADALLCGLEARPDWRGKDFLVCNSDNLYSRRAMSLLLDYPGPGAFIDYDREGLEFTAQRIAGFGVTRKNEAGFLVEIVEKPSLQEMETLRGQDGTLRVSMNIFRLQYDLVIDHLRACPVNPVRGEKELTSALTNMVREHPRALKAIPLREHVPDLTSKEDLAQVRAHLETHYDDLEW